MKNSILIWAFAMFLLVGGISGRTFFVAECVRPPEHNPNGFYDPNQCNYEVINYVRLPAAEDVNLALTACDPDGDELVFAVESEPSGMQVIPRDVNSADLIWKPVNPGLHYIDITVTDPYDANDKRTLVLDIYENQSPIITGCRKQ